VIDVTQTGTDDPAEFEVRIDSGSGQTTHRVTVASETRAALAPQAEPAELVRASFEFLLEREPAEAIMTRFDLTVIVRYFPEFDSEIGTYLR